MKKNIRMISILLAILVLAVVMNTASGAGSRSGFRDLSMNGTDSNETDTNQTDTNQTETNQTGSNQTDTNQTGSNQTDTNQTGSNQTGSNQTDTNQTGSNQTDTNQTGQNQTEVNQTNPAPSAPGTVETVTLKKLKKLKVKALTKKSIRISWTKLTKKQRKSVQKIEVQISTDKSFGSGTVTKFVKNTKSSLTVKGLKKKTKYYVRIRAYTVKDGVTHVSPWTSVKSAKTKKK